MEFSSEGRQGRAGDSEPPVTRILYTGSTIHVKQIIILSDKFEEANTHPDSKPTGSNLTGPGP
jgi:hypothetical protein